MFLGMVGLKSNTAFLTSHRNSPSFPPSPNSSLQPHRCLMPGEWGGWGGLLAAQFSKTCVDLVLFSRGITPALVPATLHSPKSPTAEPAQPRDTATRCPERTQSHNHPPKSPPTATPSPQNHPPQPPPKSPQDIAFLHVAFLL